MTELQKIERRELPSLNDLYEDTLLETLEDDAKLAVLLNAKPNEKWVRDKKGIKYLPIDRVKWLLSRIFVEWHAEVIHSFQAWNGLCVAVRLHYRHPSGVMRHVDGVGAAKIQFRKDTMPLPENIVQDSLERAYPAAYSFAVKNAAKNLGSLFGARLNDGADDIDYDLVLGRFDFMPLDGAELSELETLLTKAGNEFRAALYTDFGIESLAGLPKLKLRQFKSRILDRLNYGSANN